MEPSRVTGGRRQFAMGPRGPPRLKGGSPNQKPGKGGIMKEDQERLEKPCKLVRPYHEAFSGSLLDGGGES